MLKELRSIEGQACKVPGLRQVYVEKVTVYMFPASSLGNVQDFQAFSCKSFLYVTGSVQMCMCQG